MTAATEFATAQPLSFCVWIPTIGPPARNDTTSRVTRSTSCGNEPPLVSHSTTHSAPFEAAASTTRNAYSALFR